MKKRLLSGFTLAALLMAGSPGLRPRADESSYPTHQVRIDCALGAAVIPRDQVKKMFIADLNKAGYLVLEIGVFPRPGDEVDLYPSDFTLYTGNGAAVRAVDAASIAENIVHPDAAPSPRSPRDVQVSTGVGIGHVSYPDPATGRKTGATITSAETGIGVGGPAPGYCRGGFCNDPSSVPAADRPSRMKTAQNIEQELWENSLPDGKVNRPVAGYLYFPKPSGKGKDSALELRYENTAGRTRMTVPR